MKKQNPLIKPLLLGVLLRIARSPLRLGLLLIPLVLVCLTLSPTARAADGGLPGFNTAEGVSALSSLTTGTANTGLGENALMSNTSGHNNTATGSGALFSSSTSDNNTATGAAAHRRSCASTF